MMLLDRRRRPCFWVVGDNRCGPSISGEKEMVLGTSREDLEVSVASVTEEKSGDGKRSVGMKWRRRHPADRLSRSVTGQSRFPLRPVFDFLSFFGFVPPRYDAGVPRKFLLACTGERVLGKREIRGMGLGQARAMLSSSRRPARLKYNTDSGARGLYINKCLSGRSLHVSLL